jgi:hypothetical protein
MLGLRNRLTGEGVPDTTPDSQPDEDTDD